MKLKSVNWKKGWGRHILTTIANEFCLDCIVAPICENCCREYSMVHGTMMSWFCRIREYTASESEFKAKLSEVIETWKI